MDTDKGETKEKKRIEFYFSVVKYNFSLKKKVGIVAH